MSQVSVLAVPPVDSNMAGVPPVAGSPAVGIMWMMHQHSPVALAL